MSDDPLEPLRAHAHRLNLVSEPAVSPFVFYEIMSGGLVWGDELMEDHQFPPEVFQALRPLWAYRTSVILGAPEEKWLEYWHTCVALFPDWIGFRPERMVNSPALARIYREGKKKLRGQLKTRSG